MIALAAPEYTAEERAAALSGRSFSMMKRPVQASGKQPQPYKVKLFRVKCAPGKETNSGTTSIAVKPDHLAALLLTAPTRTEREVRQAITLGSKLIREVQHSASYSAGIRAVAIELLKMDYFGASKDDREGIEAAAINNARWALPPA